MNKNILILGALALIIALAANSYFLFAEANADGRTPVLTEKANSHFVVYFWPVAGFTATHSLFRDPCLLEHQNTTLPRIHLNYAVYGAINSVLQDPFLTHLTGNILLILLAVCIAIVFCRQEFRDAWLGLVFGALLFINWAPNNLIKLAVLAKNLLTTGAFGTQLVMPLTLTITRTLATPLALTALLLFIIAVKKPSRPTLIALGIVVALSPFVHFFLAVMLLLTLGIAAAWLAFRRHCPIRTWMLPGAITLPFLLAYALFIKVASAQTFFPDLAVDFVIYFGRALIFPPVIPFIAMLLAFGAITLSKRSPAAKALAGGLVLATVIAMNLQLVLGQNPQPNNWWQWTYSLLIPLAGVVLLADFILPRIAFKKALRWGSVALLVLLLMIQGWTMYTAAGEASYAEPAWAETVSWLGQHTSPDDVVLAPFGSTHQVNLETTAKTFVCDPFQNTATFRENALRFLQAGWVYQQTPDAIEERITEYSTKSSFILHLVPPVQANIFGILMSRTMPPYPDDSYGDVMRERQTLVRSLAGTPEARQLSYALDYVVARNGVDTVRDCLAPVALFSNEKYTVFRVDTAGCTT